MLYYYFSVKLQWSELDTTGRNSRDRFHIDIGKKVSFPGRFHSTEVNCLGGPRASHHWGSKQKPRQSTLELQFGL